MSGVPGHGRQRVYLVSGSIIGADDLADGGDGTV